MPKRDRIELRLDDELRAKVADLARVRNAPASVVIRRLVLDAHRVAFPDAVAGDGAPGAPSLPAAPVAGTTIVTGVTALHAALWGLAPTTAQQQLYTVSARGYAVGVRREQIDAVITMLIFLALVRPDDVPFVLVSADGEAAVTGRVRAMAALVRKVPAASEVLSVLRGLRMGVPTPWPSDPPRVWVAIGLPMAGNEPTWLTSRLVMVVDASADGGDHG